MGLHLCASLSVFHECLRLLDGRIILGDISFNVGSVPSQTQQVYGGALRRFLANPPGKSLFYTGRL